MTQVKTKPKAKAKAIQVNDESRPKLPETLITLQFLRTARGKSDKEIHAMLDKAYRECGVNNNEIMLERLMLHIGDISRQHNILTEFGIRSTNGGAQEREVFRSILRWWEANMPNSFAKNIRIIVEFTVLENLMYYQNTTDRYKGKLIRKEMLYPNPKVVYDFLASEIRSGRSVNLIAKHLPKYSTGKNRTAKKTIKPRSGVTEFNWSRPKHAEWVKLNGVMTDTEKIKVKAGDVVSFVRKKQSHTLEKEKFVNSWIHGFCKAIGWDIAQYKEFRKKQDTSEQMVSSKAILNMPESDFMRFLDGLTSGQRFRVARCVCRKKEDVLTPVEKWGKLGSYYMNWENKQEKVADGLRKAAASNDKETKQKLMKEFKVKSTGMQTIDLLGSLCSGSLSEQQINNTYQSLIEKMDIIANVFPIIDGSGSMGASIGSGHYETIDQPIDPKYKHIKRFDLAAAMLIAFSTRNPVDSFRNTFGWFSSDFRIVGKSKYVNDSPNKFVDRSAYTKKVNEYNVLSEEATFTDNLRAMLKANPGEVASTNMFVSVEYFVNLVKSGKIHVEDLPDALLYITDNERNTGKSPKMAMELAYSIGWYPLFIFWGICTLPDNMKAEVKNMENFLLIGGFNEGVLSQILRGIKSGSVNPEDELWAIFDDKRYSILT